MKNTYTISFLKDFACQGGDCELTCCKNWIITVDGDNLSEIQKESLFNRIKLLFFVGKRKDGLRYIRKVRGTCPYYTKEGLCRHQCDNKMNLMPKICRVYPRRVVEYRSDSISRREVTLELSCIEAASLFLKNLSPIMMVEEDNPSNIETLAIRSNESDTFLEFLIKFREELSKDIWKKEDFSETGEKWRNRVYENLIAINLLSVMNNQMMASFEIQKHLMKDFKVGGDCELDTRTILDSFDEKKLKLPIPLSVLNDIIYNSFSDKDQKKRNPIFQALRESYHEILGNDREDVAERKLLAFLLSKEHGKNALKKYLSYYEYNLYESLLETHEDYYLAGKVMFSVLYTELLILFDYILEISSNDGKLAKVLKQQKYPFEAQVLSSFERAFRHSDELKRDILGKIRANFLSYIFDSDML